MTEAMKHPRQVDVPLVDAYLARRALDYLVGFNLSPVLWRKLPGAKSAGRVQSVCLRLIVEREMEIEAFRAQEYWTVEALLQTPRGPGVRRAARLARRQEAGQVRPRQRRRRPSWRSRRSSTATSRVTGGRGQARRAATPRPPFMTSTLQQEASRKFGMGAKACMSAAQRLYEAGHITYMRTDGIDMAPEAVMAARDAIKDRFGDGLRPQVAAHVQEQGQERAGSARMHPAHRHDAATPTRCGSPTATSASSTT